jgi:hypothetical protein
VPIFETIGLRQERDGKLLHNICFHQSDLMNAVEVMEDSVMICLHGCNEVNQQAIDLALSHGATGWLVMPCCITADQYLGNTCKVRLSDEQRYSMLCGAMASSYDAQLVTNIDCQITNRSIMLAGGIGRNVEGEKKALLLS